MCFEWFSVVILNDLNSHNKSFFNTHSLIYVLKEDLVADLSSALTEWKQRSDSMRIFGFDQPSFMTGHRLPVTSVIHSYQ